MKCYSLGFYMMPTYINAYFQLKVYLDDNTLEKSFLSLPLDWLAPAISQTLGSAQKKFNSCSQNSSESFEFPMDCPYKILQNLFPF